MHLRHGQPLVGVGEAVLVHVGVPAGVAPPPPHPPEGDDHDHEEGSSPRVARRDDDDARHDDARREGRQSFPARIDPAVPPGHLRRRRHRRRRARQIGEEPREVPAGLGRHGEAEALVEFALVEAPLGEVSAELIGDGGTLFVRRAQVGVAKIGHGTIIDHAGERGTPRGESRTTSLDMTARGAGDTGEEMGLSAVVQTTVSGGIGAGAIVVFILLLIFEVAAMWRIFQKAGRPGWASIVPIYNTYVLFKIVGRSGWWVLLYLIPFVNLVVTIVLCYDLAKSFGKGLGYTLGLLVFSFVFFPMLGFGSARYLGPSAGSGYGLKMGGYGYATVRPTGISAPSPAGADGPGWGDAPWTQGHEDSGSLSMPGAHSEARTGQPADTEAAPAAPAVPAGWHPDPMGRHELRWWDSERWSEHVFDSGRPSTDPL